MAHRLVAACKTFLEKCLRYGDMPDSPKIRCDHRKKLEESSRQQTPQRGLSHLVCPRLSRTSRIPSPSPQYRTAQLLSSRRSILGRTLVFFTHTPAVSQVATRRLETHRGEAPLLLGSANRTGKGLAQVPCWLGIVSWHQSFGLVPYSSGTTIMCCNVTDKKST